MTATVIVVGAGHSGLEAAFAAARVGARVIVVTGSRKTIGQTPCNPSIGGVAKGHLVHEIEAMGGLMGRAADACAIHGKILNTSKGPAVRSTRLQVDKDRYHAYAAAALLGAPNMIVVEGLAERILTRNVEGRGEVFRAIALRDGREIEGDAVVVTTGTFLGGVLHTGHQQTPGGRVGEAPALGLSQSLRDLGFSLSRLKTGTPPRLRAGSLDFSHFEPQASDEPFPRFCADDEPEQPGRLPHVDCHMVHTTSETAAIIREHLHESPLYSGKIQGIGPRYCPSIEDKIVRFAHREQHLVFMEPEGLDTDWIYPNGISTSLPLFVQELIVKTIPGCSQAEIVRAGYAVEYDAVDARQLNHRFRAKSIDGLYFAGQINGTSGYEEAGAQGLLAGANAALAVLGRDGFELARDQAYLGVLIDDLVTQGCDEPYRMFTSRAEYRLLLREDNAQERLSAICADIGLIDAARRERDLVRLERVAAAELALARGEDVAAAYSPDIIRRASARRVYAGYIERQRFEAKRMEGEGLALPADIDYFEIPGLGSEAAQRLTKVRPATTGQAARISGMTPGALACLWAYARQELRRQNAAEKKALAAHARASNVDFPQ